MPLLEMKQRLIRWSGVLCLSTHLSPPHLPCSNLLCNLLESLCRMRWVLRLGRRPAFRFGFVPSLFFDDNNGRVSGPIDAACTIRSLLLSSLRKLMPFMTALKIANFDKGKFLLPQMIRNFGITVWIGCCSMLCKTVFAVMESNNSLLVCSYSRVRSESAFSNVGLQPCPSSPSPPSSPCESGSPF